MLMAPSHPLAGRKQVSMSELGEQDVIAHNEASPAREKVLRLFEQRHEKLNITVALPSLDGIKRAVEMNLGVALLPRRCAVTELARGTLVATTVPQLRLPRHLRLIYRQTGELSHAAQQFLAVAKKHEQAEAPRRTRRSSAESSEPEARRSRPDPGRCPGFAAAACPRQRNSRPVGSGKR